MIFILASNNSKKLAEMRGILSPLGIELLSQSEAGLSIEVEENGSTFEENSRLKALGACDLVNAPCIADNSGLCVDALGGAPGVYSARYGGESCRSDKDRYELLLRNMEGVTDRRAKFVCVITCVFPNGDSIVSRGECPGEILTAPRGEGGFGYDPLFYSHDLHKTFAEASAGEKNTVSHRARALKKLVEIMRNS